MIRRDKLDVWVSMLLADNFHTTGYIHSIIVTIIWQHIQACKTTDEFMQLHVLHLLGMFTVNAMQCIKYTVQNVFMVTFPFVL